MERPRIALLNAAHDDDHTRRNFRRELDATLVEFRATERELPAGFAFDGFVVTGSRASVYWDEPWIADLKSWTREAIDRGLAGLGVCFGHQLLADVLGGKVEAMADYEIGYREVRRQASPLFDGVDAVFTVFTTHSDRVAELPEGARLLAENDRGIHAFRQGRIFGVQFHPEYDRETARTVTRGKDELDAKRKRRVLDGITEANYRGACEAKQVFGNFTRMVTAGTTAGGRPGVAADD